jgi:hypothetical protein
VRLAGTRKLKPIVIALTDSIRDTIISYLCKIKRGREISAGAGELVLMLMLMLTAQVQQPKPKSNNHQRIK